MSKSFQRRSRPCADSNAGLMTSRMKIARAASTVATCRSSFEPKCAKRPLLLIDSSSASRPIVRPSSPSAEAMWTAVSRIALRVRSPCAFLLMSRKYIARTFVLEKDFQDLAGLTGYTARRYETFELPRVSDKELAAHLREAWKLIAPE